MTGHKNARHYQAAAWVDFVRGLVIGTDHGRMQAHLDIGCEKCRQLAGFYARVAARAAADAGYQLPDSVVQHVRGVYRNKYPQDTRTLHTEMRRAA
jgi:hypothetical protein